MAYAYQQFIGQTCYLFASVLLQHVVFIEQFAHLQCESCMSISMSVIVIMQLLFSAVWNKGERIINVVRIETGCPKEGKKDGLYSHEGEVMIFFCYGKLVK